MIKRNKLRRSALLGGAVACLLCVSLLLSSCMAIPGNSIIGAQVNENGELVVSYLNGTEENLGTVQGADGTNGADGQDGADGLDGLNGASSEAEQIINATARGLRSAVSITCKFTKAIGGTSYGSAGSGVIYQMNKSAGTAYIITNYHVVYDANCNTSNKISNQITVFLYGAEYDDLGLSATYVGGSMNYDIAVLRVENTMLSTAEFASAVAIADSDKITVGESAIAIGNPEGYGIAASSGVVSVDSENITMTGADDSTKVTMRLMRIDTAVNSGNSGGGLFNSRGQLIGIVNAKIIDESVENIAYAIPSNVAIAVANNIMEHGSSTVLCATLGIEVGITDSKAVYDAETGSISLQEVITVNSVQATGIAYQKIQKGDHLVSATLNQGEPLVLTRQHMLTELLLNARVGDTLTLVIRRNNAEETVSINITSACMKIVA